MTRKELIKALRCFASEGNCPVDECNEKCPYWMEDDKFDLYSPHAEISDEYQLCRAAADMLEQDASLKKELEAAKRDIAEMLVSTPECDWCKRYYDQSCEYPYCKNPLCYARDLLCKAVWRGPCAENGGKDDAQ